MQTKSSVALLHYAYPPHIGGVEHVMCEHAKILADLGLDVHIFTGSGESDDSRIIVHQYPQLGSIATFNPKLQERIFTGIFDTEFDSLTNELTLIFEHELSQFDCIIVHNMLSLSHNLALIEGFKRFAKSTNKNIIAYVHDHTYIGGNNSIVTSKTYTSSRQRELLTSLIPNTRYVCISQTLRKTLSQILPLSESEIHVVPNGVNPPSFLGISPRLIPLIQKENLFSSYPLIICPTNLLPRKNIEQTLRIIYEIKKSFSQVKVMITGNKSQHKNTTEYANTISALINELDLHSNIVFVKNYISDGLKDHEMYDFYGLADAMFYFSHHENFGIPLLEAALSKTPIFISDLEVFHEIVGDQNGVHFASKSMSPAEIAKEVLGVLSNQGARFRYKVRKDFNTKTIVESLLIPLIIK